MKKIIDKVLYFIVFTNTYFFIVILMNMLYERFSVFKDVCNIRIYEIAYPRINGGHHYMALNVGSVLSLICVFAAMYGIKKLMKVIVKKIKNR